MHEPKPGLLRIQLVMHQASGFTEAQDGSVVVRASSVTCYHRHFPIPGRLFILTGTQVI